VHGACTGVYGGVEVACCWISICCCCWSRANWPNICCCVTLPMKLGTWLGLGLGLGVRVLYLHVQGCVLCF